MRISPHVVKYNIQTKFMQWLEDQFEIIIFKIARYLLKRGYGYCEERDGEVFMKNGRCCACDASDVQDFIANHISLIEKW